MIAAILQLQPGTELPFSDVSPSDWYAGALSALYQVGIVQGSAEGTFRGADEVQRQQAATFVVRALAYRNGTAVAGAVPIMTDTAEAAPWLGGFRDRGAVSPSHAVSVANAYRLGFISGYDDGRFYPFVTLSRAQAAGILYASLGSELQPRSDPPQAVEAEKGYPTLTKGSAGPLVSWLERRLATLSYRPGAVDGAYDGNTADAVVAFQKVQGFNRSGAATDATVRTLVTAQRPRARKAAGGKRVEVDLTRQVLFLVENGSVTATIPVSTGREGLRTPTGTYSVERKLPYWRESALGLLYKPAYFHGGYAIHGAPSVPVYPASHGCVRVAVTTMDWLYPLLPVGTRVDTYY
jgi:lipoprotein-anchoring transpeptidase ErfK/SrfK